ncbi:MAG: hypothetical protein ACE5IP_11235 [Terriglobia bacterium]
MGKINLGRVILGGLLAGVVINISEFILNAVVLMRDMEEALKALNLSPVGGGAIGIFVVQGFVMGIVTVWLYAAIRPRFGPGPRTALLAGLVVWFLTPVLASVGFLVMGFFPAKPVAIGIVWTLAELLLASVAGAWLYKEE